MTVTIVLALYNPRIDWLELQLRSIAGQTYQDIELIACDDASPDVPFHIIDKAFSDCLGNIPYKLTRNRENMGSNLTFESLISQAEGDYISFCDQDDIWLPDKTERLLMALKQSDATLAYTDLSVIDINGIQTANSLQHVRRRLHHLHGDKLASVLLFRNFTNGTAMMMPTPIAKGALPLVKDMVADHWLTLWAAVNGSITYIPQVLVHYRLHDCNQSAVMAGVFDKSSYLARRILPGSSRFEQFKIRLNDEHSLQHAIEDGLCWFKAREQWLSNKSDVRKVWKYRKLGIHVTMFELLAARLPEKLFIFLVRLVQRGVL